MVSFIPKSTFKQVIKAAPNRAAFATQKAFAAKVSAAKASADKKGATTLKVATPAQTKTVAKPVVTTAAKPAVTTATVAKAATPSFEAASSSFTNSVSSFAGALTSIMASLPQDYQNAIKGAMDTISAAVTVISSTVATAKTAPASPDPVTPPADAAIISPMPAAEVLSEPEHINVDDNTSAIGSNIPTDTVINTNTLPLENTLEVTPNDGIPTPSEEVVTTEQPPVQVVDIPSPEPENAAPIINPEDISGNRQTSISEEAADSTGPSDSILTVTSSSNAAPNEEVLDNNQEMTAAFLQAVNSYTSNQTISSPDLSAIEIDQQVNVSA